MEPDVIRRDEILELLQALIRIPSVNPSIAPQEGETGEERVARFACEWLSCRGIRAWTEEVAQGRTNAVACVGESSGPTLVFCAHLDTVGTTGMDIAPFEPRVEGSRVFGRGSYDMKGSVAAIMAVAASLSREALPGRLLLALVADEEYASLGATDFVRRHDADACIVTEPSQGELILAHKGFVWAELVTTGEAAHGSRWDLGVSAIGKMGRIIVGLEELDHLELQQRSHPLLGPPSLHCALIEGGIGLSTYAPHCRLKIERRTLPGETGDQVLQELRDVVDRVGEEAEITCLLERAPLTCDRRAAVACALREAATFVTGDPPAETGVAYWMDAAIFADGGIPTVNYGPSGAGAHSASEWVDLDSVLTCAQVLRRATLRFFGLVEA